MHRCQERAAYRSGYRTPAAVPRILASAPACLVGAIVAVLVGVLAPHVAHAEDRASPPPAPATVLMSCERAAEAGRVRCSVEARAETGRTLAWGDVALLQLPEFATPLKGRIGPADTTVREAGVLKWAFGVVAKRAGQGEARARVRLVVCHAREGGPPRCAPESIEVRAMISVGG